MLGMLQLSQGNSNGKVQMLSPTERLKRSLLTAGNDLIKLASCLNRAAAPVLMQMENPVPTATPPSINAQMPVFLEFMACPAELGKSGIQAIGQLFSELGIDASVLGFPYTP